MGENAVASELSRHLVYLESLQMRVLRGIRAFEQFVGEARWIVVDGHRMKQEKEGAEEEKLGGNFCVQNGLPQEEEEAEIVEERMRRILLQAGVSSFAFQRVPADYYDRPLEERRDLLGAASVDHLCKSIVMVNTQAHESVKDCSDFCNSKYYVVIIQYSARLNAEKVRHFVYSLNNGNISKKKFNMRLAPEDEAFNLTGFSHNAVTPIGMRTKIPVILSDAITKLNPDFFWLGAGEVDLKLGINTHEFITTMNPFIVDCTY